jgi:hypothetical protein
MGIILRPGRIVRLMVVGVQEKVRIPPAPFPKPI